MDLDDVWEQLPKGYDWITSDSDGVYFAWCSEPRYSEGEKMWWSYSNKTIRVRPKDRGKGVFFAKRHKGE